MQNLRGEEGFGYWNFIALPIAHFGFFDTSAIGKQPPTFPFRRDVAEVLWYNQQIAANKIHF
jgi:hypothetical protein